MPPLRLKSLTQILDSNSRKRMYPSMQRQTRLLTVLPGELVRKICTSVPNLTPIQNFPLSLIRIWWLVQPVRVHVFRLPECFVIPASMSYRDVTDLANRCFNTRPPVLWHISVVPRINVKCRKLHTATAAMLCVTDRAGEQPRLQSKPVLTDFDLQPYTALVCHLTVSTAVSHVIRRITTHLPIAKGWKA